VQKVDHIISVTKLSLISFCTGYPMVLTVRRNSG